MDQIQTHPSNAAQAKTFIAPGSLSFPGGAGELTPPSSEADKQNVQRQLNGSQQGVQVPNSNGVTPATPAATPGATQGVSGIVPTLQYVSPLSFIFQT
jgi:transcription initiation factor TFIID TATA-box-binding protein